MGRLTSEERHRILLLKEQAVQPIRAPSLVATAAIDRDGERCRWLQRVPSVAFGLALATAGLLLYAFVGFHLPGSMADAFLPRS